MNRYHFADPKPFSGHIVKYRHADYIVGKIMHKNTKIVVTPGRVINDKYTSYITLKHGNLPLDKKFEKPFIYDSIDDMLEDFSHMGNQ